MKKLKKLAAIIMVCALALTMLTACDGTGGIGGAIEGDTFEAMVLKALGLDATSQELNEAAKNFANAVKNLPTGRIEQSEYNSAIRPYWKNINQIMWLEEGDQTRLVESVKYFVDSYITRNQKELKAIGIYKISNGKHARLNTTENDTFYMVEENFNGYLVVAQYE